MPAAAAPRRKHIPQRTCVACRSEKAKRDLVRIVRALDGIVDVDLTGKRSGRGAYLCLEPACWDRGLSGSALSHALKAPLTEEDWARLRDFAVRLADTSVPVAPVVPAKQARSKQR